jgi:hypothetical protein
MRKFKNIRKNICSPATARVSGFINHLSFGKGKPDFTLAGKRNCMIFHKHIGKLKKFFQQLEKSFYDSQTCMTAISFSFTNKRVQGIETSAGDATSLQIRVFIKGHCFYLFNHSIVLGMNCIAHTMCFFILCTHHLIKIGSCCINPRNSIAKCIVRQGKHHDHFAKSPVRSKNPVKNSTKFNDRAKNCTSSITKYSVLVINNNKPVITFFAGIITGKIRFTVTPPLSGFDNASQTELRINFFQHTGVYSRGRSPPAILLILMPWSYSP